MSIENFISFSVIKTKYNGENKLTLFTDKVKPFDWVLKLLRSLKTYSLLHRHLGI